MPFTPTEKNKIAKITIQSEITNLPIRIKLSDSSGITHVDLTKIHKELVVADRKKMAIFKSDGVTEIPVEINYWDSANKLSELFIANPTTTLKGSSRDNFIFLHADKNEANNTNVGDIGEAIAQSVWVDDIGVWHLSQDPTGTIKDSTSNALNGANVGGITASELISAQTGRGYNLNSITGGVGMGTDATLNLVGDTVIEAFFRTGNTLSGINATIIAKALGANDSSGANFLYRMVVRPTNRLNWFHEHGSGVNVDLDTTGTYIFPNTNYYVVMMRDDSEKEIHVYVNGEFKETLSYATSADGGASGTFAIGYEHRGAGPSQLSKELISEVRITNIIRSATYIKDNYDSLRDRLLYFETTTANALTKKSKLKVFRRLWIRRRLDDSSGDYETDWQNITEFVKKWGSIGWQIDEKKYNFISQRGFTLTLDNTKGTFDLEQSESSMFNGFLTRYRTLVRVEAGYIDPITGGDVPNPNVLFYGLTASEPILQNSNQEVIFNVKPLLSVIDEIPANKIADVTDFKTLWVVDATTDKIYNIQIDGTLISSFATSVFDVNAISTRGIVFQGSDGSLWVTDSNTDKVYNIETDGTLKSSFATSVFDASAISLSGITISSDGTLWVVDSSTDKVYNIETDGTLNSSFETSVFDASATNPRGISFDTTDNTLWVGDLSTNLIYHIEIDGTLIDSFPLSNYDSNAVSTDGLNVSNDGTIWVADPTTDKIYNIKKTGELISSFGKNTFDSLAVNLTGVTVEEQKLTSSDFLTKIKNVTDGASNFILQKFISTSAWNIDVTTNTLTTLNQIEQIDGISCLEMARRLAEIENKTIYIDRSGSFNFIDKTASTTIDFRFIGLPFKDQTYGHTIKKINNHMDDIDLLFNKVFVKFDDTVTAQVLKEESWTVGDSSTSWKYGVKELSISNNWFSSVTAEKIASNLFADLATIKTKVDFTCKFVPHLDLLDRVQLKYDPAASSIDTKWNLFNWDEANWANESSPFFNFEGKDFKLVKMVHNLDRMETNFIAREI